MFVGCANNALDSNFVPNYLDSDDIDNNANKIAQEFLKSSFLKWLPLPKKPDDRARIMICVNDATNEKEFGEYFTNRLKEELFNGNIGTKLRILNIPCTDSPDYILDMLNSIRGHRNNDEFNQYTTIEKGELISAEYILGGKITQRSRIIGDEVIDNFRFSFSLVSLKTGETLWIKNTQLNKNAFDRNEIYEEIIEQDSINNEVESQENEIFEYEAVEVSQIPSEQIENLSSNHFLLGFDIGIGGGKLNNARNYSATFLLMPIHLRLGYFRDIWQKWGVGVNFLYSYISIPGLNNTDDDRKINAKIQRIGGEILGYHKLNDIAYLYVGGGILKDIKMSINQQNNKKKRRSALNQIEKSWYPLVKLGVVVNFNNYWGIDFSGHCNFPVGEASFVKASCNASVGLQLKI